MPEPTPDLRTLAAEALDLKMDGYLGDIHTIGDLADAVLAAVLPAHRAVVLQGAADFLDPGPRDPKPEGEMTSADWVRAARRGAASNLRMWASPAFAHMWPPTTPASTVEPDNGPAVSLPHIQATPDGHDGAQGDV